MDAEIDEYMVCELYFKRLLLYIVIIYMSYYIYYICVFYKWIHTDQLGNYNNSPVRRCLKVEPES